MTPPDWTSDRGSVTAFVLVLIIAVIAFAGLVLDGGLAVAAKVQAVSQAQSAARAGARDVDIASLRLHGVVEVDPVAARADSANWLARSATTGTVTATPQAVTVTVVSSSPTQLLQLFGIRSIPVRASAMAVPVHP